jgi:hypothetical protein
MSLQACRQVDDRAVDTGVEGVGLDLLGDLLLTLTS